MVLLAVCRCNCPSNRTRLPNIVLSCCVAVTRTIELAELEVIAELAELAAVAGVVEGPGLYYN